jgi:hypothetical protein
LQINNPGLTVAPTVEGNIMIQEHRELLWLHHLVKNVDKACVKLLLDAFDVKFMSTQADRIGQKLIIDWQNHFSHLYFLQVKQVLCVVPFLAKNVAAAVQCDAPK